MVKMRSLKDVILTCYLPYEKIGISFKYEIVEKR